jgi:hypothetical protein
MERWKYGNMEMTFRMKNIHEAGKMRREGRVEGRQGEKETPNVILVARDILGRDNLIGQTIMTCPE